MVTEPNTVEILRADLSLSLQGMTRTWIVFVLAVPFWTFVSVIVVRTM